MTQIAGRVPPTTSGFTLVELAVVLIIVGYLLGGILVSLGAAREVANRKEAERQLAAVSEALLGYASVNSRLPCPAAPGTSGVESPVGGGACTNPHDGFLPAITLGIQPADAQGFAIDPWNNRIRYATTAKNASAYTTNNGIRTAWASGPTTLVPDLRICSSATDSTGAAPDRSCASGPPSTGISNNAVAIILSTGQNGAVIPTSADELANMANDRLFVSRLAGSDFDDIVVWISPHILYNRMITAGQLP